MDYANLIFTVHFACTLYMTGLIWFVQLVHYPLMDSVGADGYTQYQKAHMRQTTWAVAPAMLGEVSTALALLFIPSAIFPPAAAYLGVSLLLLVWLSTAALQVPSHSSLLDGFEPGAHRKLVRTNWIRTLGWTARALLVGGSLLDGLG